MEDVRHNGYARFIHKCDDAHLHRKLSTLVVPQGGGGTSMPYGSPLGSNYSVSGMPYNSSNLPMSYDMLAYPPSRYMMSHNDGAVMYMNECDQSLVGPSTMMSAADAYGAPYQEPIITIGRTNGDVAMPLNKLQRMRAAKQMFNVLNAIDEMDKNIV